MNKKYPYSIILSCILLGSWFFVLLRVGPLALRTLLEIFEVLYYKNLEILSSGMVFGQILMGALFCFLYIFICGWPLALFFGLWRGKSWAWFGLCGLQLAFAALATTLSFLKSPNEWLSCNIFVFLHLAWLSCDGAKQFCGLADIKRQALAKYISIAFFVHVFVMLFMFLLGKHPAAPVV